MNLRRINFTFIASIVCCVALGLTGCTKVKALPREQAVFNQPGPAMLAAGDLVEFKFPYAPELNDTQSVRADGHVSLQLIGEVRAAGRSPGDLAAELQQQYAAHLKQPNVTVILRNGLSNRVFIGGEVRLPGAIPMSATMDVFDVLAMAGGMDLASAAVGHVIVMRHTDDGKRTAYRVDMRPVVRGEATEPFLLQPGDHVYVPRTAITNVNQFMRQYVAGVVPKTGVFASRTVGDTNVGIDTSPGGF